MHGDTRICGPQVLSSFTSFSFFLSRASLSVILSFFSPSVARKVSDSRSQNSPRNGLLSAPVRYPLVLSLSLSSPPSISLYGSDAATKNNNNNNNKNESRETIPVTLHSSCLNLLDHPGFRPRMAPMPSKTADTEISLGPRIIIFDPRRISRHTNIFICIFFSPLVIRFRYKINCCICVVVHVCLYSLLRVYVMVIVVRDH